MSVGYLVRKGCSVKFVIGGGEIHVSDGKMLPFFEKQGVFFIGLNVKQPDGMSDGESDLEMHGFSRPAP